METNIQKWGNSLGVRLPGKLAQRHALKVGSRVRVEETKNGLSIINLDPAPQTLDELVSSITAKNRHTEIAWGEKSVGKEIW